MSLEGMMLTGALAAAVGARATGDPLVGLAVALLAVLPLALLQAFLSVTLGANQIVTGIGLNILCLGGTTLAYRDIFGSRSDAAIPALATWAPPGLRDLPLVGHAVFEQVWLLYPGLALLGAVAWMLRSTALGLAIHASGAEPGAVDKAGMSVTRVRYGVVLFSGLLAAVAGSFISIGDIHTFTEGMTSGAGYLAIAAIIFGNWKPGRTLLACLLFGAASALQFYLPAIGVVVPSALLIMLPYLLALLAVAGLIGRQTAPAFLTQHYRRT
jgi:simple sugar transport system permease protein